jgi:DNA-binding transcriptional LysR family regulator
MTGRVRFGVPYDLMGQELAAALKAFEIAWPQVEVSLVCAASPDLLMALKRGEIDVALVEEPVGTALHERLNVQCLHIERLVWVGAAGGSAFSKQPLPVSLVAPTCSFRPSIVTALQNQGRAWRTVFESGNIEATCATVRADLAVTAWLAFTVPGDLQILSANSGLPDLPPFAINLYQHQSDPEAATSELALAIIRAFKR